MQNDKISKILVSILIRGTACLLFFSETLRAESDFDLSVIQLQGRIEYLAAGQSDWQFVRLLDKLPSNGRFRSHGKSVLNLKIPGDIELVLSQKSMVQILSSEFRSGKNQIITVTEGSLFVSKPENARNLDFPYRLYSPTASVIGSAASFLMRIADSGATEIFCFRGLLQIKNVTLKESYALSAGKFLHIQKDEAPSMALPFDSEDLEKERLWIGRDILDRELTLAKLEESRFAANLQGRELAKVLIPDFKIRNAAFGVWRPDSVLADQAQDEISLHTPFEIKRVPFTKNWVAEAKVQGAAFVVLGDIDQFTLYRKIALAADSSLIKRWLVEAKLRVEIVHVASGKRVADFNFTKTVNFKPGEDNFAIELSKTQLDASDLRLQGGPVEEILQELQANWAKLGQALLPTRNPVYLQQGS